MLGNGGLGILFGANRGWGMMNMILSDTMGQPLTAHWRKSANRNAWVDFVTDSSELDDVPGASDDKMFGLFSDPAPTTRQKGNFPDKVAPWLQQQLSDLEISVELTNDWKPLSSRRVPFKDLGFEGLFGGVDINRLNIPDFGYNYLYQSNIENETMRVIRKGRKRTPDLKLQFRDNNKGRREWDETKYAYGFNISLFLADLEGAGGIPSNIGTFADPVDATRINITNLYSPGSAFRVDLKSTMTDKQWKNYKKAMKDRERDKPIYDRLYEFLAVSDVLADVNPIDYPTFCASFGEYRPISPLIYALTDMITKNNTTVPPTSDPLAAFINETMTLLTTTIAQSIASNESAFKYGAKYDSLSEDDAEYLAPSDLDGFGAGGPYEDAEILDEEDGGYRSLRNSDMILGVSRDQLQNGDENARVFYLDPSTYGGKYTNPAVYIKPLKNEGYLGMVNVMFPEFSPCKPRDTDLVDFKSIEDEISTAYISIPEDQRLQADPDCVTEVPFNRILSRPGKAGIQGLIRAACRIYASTHFLKTFGTFSLFKPDFTNVYGPIYPQYVVENMERSLRDSQGAFWEMFNTFSDNEFWYAFLEQAVQTYGRLVDSGEIVNPPEAVLQALFRINDAQEKFKYPKITNRKNDVKQANKLHETDAPYRWPLKSRGLRIYREEKNLEAVQAREEDAKIILNEFMIQEMNYMGEKFMSNIETAMGMKPVYHDIAYYIFSELCLGADSLTLYGDITEVPVALPTSGDSYYTGGGEFSLPDGSEYVGAYHVHTDDDNNIIYMVGEFHTSEEHDELNPFAHKITVPIGDIADFGTGLSSDASRPFVLEKYIKVNNNVLSTEAGRALVRANDSSKNISDIYPGTMQQVVDPVSGQVVGVSGELGVQYGIMFSVIISGTKYTLAREEMSALDLKVGAMAPLSGNSKLLLCLINKLKENSDFKIATQYIFPFNKILSTLAIYNDMGFLPSIGELTVEPGTAFPKPWPPSSWNVEFDAKPGAKIKFPGADSGDYNPEYVVDGNTERWISVEDRTIFTPFNLDWDDWDQVVLRNSKSRIKKLFKQHYYDRDFNPSEMEGTDFAGILVKNLKASFQPPTGKRILPWFKRRNVRDNPFNSKGQLCKKHEK